MNTQSKQHTPNVYSLPVEIILLILQNCHPRDIFNFCATCKQYKDVKNNNVFWKKKCSTVFPPTLYKYIEEFCNGSWLSEVKYYYELKRKIHVEIMAISPKYYWINRNYYKDFVKFTPTFSSYIASPKNCYYVIHMLQDNLKTGTELLDKNICVRPYTMTDLHYTKMLLRQIFHAYMASKWVRCHTVATIPPVVVINFFLQWIDPTKFYFDEIYDKKINDLVKEVNEHIEVARRRTGLCSELQIIEAVSHVIYQQGRICPTDVVDFDTIDVNKVLDNGYGNTVVVAAIYEALVTRCGGSCQLIAYPNNLGIIWQNKDSPGKELYNIDLTSGVIYPKPFDPHLIYEDGFSHELRYFELYLLHYMFLLFTSSLGKLKTWNGQNAHYLKVILRFQMHSSLFEHNPYNSAFNKCFKNDINSIPRETPDINQLTNHQIQIILQLNDAVRVDENVTKSKVPRRRISSLKYAVGMICYHTKRNILCVVQGWHLNGHNLYYPLPDQLASRNQPFYRVTDANHTEEYFAQENLIEVTRPTQMRHLEFTISRHFTHFDGFAYVPNDEKRAQYPEDEQIVEVFRAICKNKPNNI